MDSHISENRHDKKRKHKYRLFNVKKHSKRERGSYDLTRPKRKRRGMNWFVRTIVFLRVYFDAFIDWLFGYFCNHNREYIKKIEDPILVGSATSLAKKIREGKLKSEDLVRACFKRIDEVNSIINAVVDSRFEKALNDAREIDENIKKGVYSENDFEEKPFLGVPFTSKESTACKGLKWTFGLVPRKHIVADEDAEVIRLMKKAGAIMIGVTNIPQLNLWVESYNPLYGLTRNPYNTTRNAGGSSGGEGAIIASCGSPMGVGTDIGGSIRIPCFVNGIFGHKPTSNVISTKGLTFRKGNEGPTMVTAGPMARHSVDLIPMLKVLLDQNVTKFRLDDPVDKVRIFYCLNIDDPLVSKIRPEMQDIVVKVVENLENICIEAPKEVNFPNMQYCVRLWSYWMSKEPGFDFRSSITNNTGRLNLFTGLAHTLFLSGEYGLPVMYYLINTYLPKMDSDFANKITEELRNEILTMLGEDGVLIFPSGVQTATHHYTTLFRPWNAAITAMWNALNLPVTQVPTGLDEDGLPLGVQVVTSPFRDHLSIGVARHIEKIMGGYVPPCEIVQ